MELKFNPMDYLTEDEMADISREEARKYIRHKFTEENIAFSIIKHFTDEFLVESKVKIQEAVKEQLSRFEPCIKYNDVTREIVKEVIQENAQAIKDKVQWKIEQTLEGDAKDLEWEISNAISETLLKILKGEVK